MQLDTDAANVVAAALRAPGPLEPALQTAADSLRAALGVACVIIAVKHEARTVRGVSGSLDAGAVHLPLRDGELQGTLSVCGLPRERIEALALVVKLALSARFLGESAQIDGLTGALNRRSFDERLHEEWQRAARGREPLALAMIDIDFFKAYNDRLGHLAGDDALRRVAHAAAASLQRAGDRFARYGGEEFAVILPGTDLEGAIETAEHLRAAVSALAISHPLSKTGRLSVSIGLAVADPQHQGSPDELIAAADHELYRAKAAGRDRVVAAGYASDEILPGAVPQPLSTLVGRDAELSEIVGALEEARLVTVTGPVGVGKTRLALAIAADHAERFDHVRFVDMVGTLDAQDILARVKAVLGTTGKTLIVLDGCERVTEACREALGIADTSARVLATSRIPLNAPGEHVLRIQPLEAAAARELFSHRCRIADVPIDLRDPAVGRLLRRLAGSPLAIELAVARLKSTSAERLLADFGDEAGAEQKRPTLASLLSTAISTLEPEQMRALCAVSVFAGAFSGADAAAVIPPPELDERAADRLLRGIAERSLLDAASHDGTTRWRMIDPVRDAALASASAADIRKYSIAAHLRWCTQRFRTFDARYGRVENSEFVRIVAPFSMDFQIALERALADETLIGDGMDLCWEAGRYWFAIGQIKEARARCDEFLDRADGQDARRHARLLLSAARLSFVDGDITAMEGYTHAAVALIGDTDSQERSALLNYQGIGAKFRGEYDAAERFFVECRDLNVRIGNRRGEAIAIGALGTIAMDVRVDYAAGAALYESAAELFRDLDDALNHVTMASNLAEALANLGELERAEAIAQRALREARLYRNALVLTQCMCVLAFIWQAMEKWREACTLLEEAREVIATQSQTIISAVFFVLCARAAVYDDQHALAGTFLGAAQAVDAELALPTLPAEAARRKPVEEAVRERLDEPACARAMTLGKSLSQPQLRELAHAVFTRAMDRSARAPRRTGVAR